MVITFLRAPRFSRASAKSSVFRERLCSFLNIFCKGLMGAVTVFIDLVKFFQGSHGWSNPKSSLLFESKFSFVPSQAACRVMVRKNCYSYQLILVILLAADIDPSDEHPGPNVPV